MTSNNANGMEFPEGSALPPEGRERRDFVRLLGASMALAGLTGCIRAPDEEIHPQVDGTPNATPGVPLHYATAMTLDGCATGVIVQSNDGRPTKVEGNPQHPASLGGAGVFEQASILELYDPRRAQTVRNGLRPASVAQLFAAFEPLAVVPHVGARGAGLGLLLEPTASPLTRMMLDRVRSRYPDVNIFFHAPLANAETAAASVSAFGQVLNAQHDFRQANVVVALGADPLASGAFHLRYARDFAERRRNAKRPVLHVAETCPSPTSTLADSRIALSPGALTRVAAALLAHIVRQVDGGVTLNGDLALSDAERAWVSTVAAQLVRERGRSVVIAGPLANADLQLFTHALNDVLHNVGECVSYIASPIIEAGQRSHDMRALSNALDSLDTLVVLQGNACYSAPPDVEFERRYGALRHTLYLGSFDNETARASGWHLPGTHYLEEWGLERAYDGTESVVQPLIAPLHGGRTIAEALALIAGMNNATSSALTRESWNSTHSNSITQWNEALRQGVVADSASARVTHSLHWRKVADAYATIASRGLRSSADTVATSHVVEVAIGASRTLHDGRFSDNPWLQELPDAVTKLTWDNAALLSPATARALKVTTGQVIRVETDNASVELPALLVPGHANAAITLAIGYGRRGGELVARGVGVDVNLVRSIESPYLTQGRVRALDRHHELALTQTHFSIEGRAESILGIRTNAFTVPTGSAAEQRVSTADSANAAQPAFRSNRKPLTLYEPPAPPASGFGADQWAMTIDLDQCTGCSACVVACQSENNIPVVGPADVLKGREMHWMRIDRYVSDDDAHHIGVQPMLCQHCENAPCEYVCPVNATVHSDDGLNEMIYNRCVGTRFCSNNCPYKVRRFNWFEYNGGVTDVESMQKNPEVTVRSRGVMEKCTFCVQRLRRAQMDAELAGERVTRPVLTACQQTCPTQAIVFGSLTSPGSEVAALQQHPRAFSALAELGTVPRVRYLARVPRDAR